MTGCRREYISGRTHQLLVYADNVDILGGSVQTVKKNAEALIVASKEIGLEVDADKTEFLNRPTT